MEPKRELKSPISGKVEVIIRDASHATVSFESVRVNGLEQSGHFQMLRLDGHWDLRNAYKEGSEPAVSKHERLFLALYVSQKWDGRRFKDASVPTRARIIEKLLPVAAKFLEDNPNLVIEAEREKLRKEIAKAEREIGEFEGEITRRKAHIATLRECFGKLR